MHTKQIFCFCPLCLFLSRPGNSQHLVNGTAPSVNGTMNGGPVDNCKKPAIAKAPVTNPSPLSSGNAGGLFARLQQKLSGTMTTNNSHDSTAALRNGLTKSIEKTVSNPVVDTRPKLSPVTARSESNRCGKSAL